MAGLQNAYAFLLAHVQDIDIEAVGGKVKQVAAKQVSAAVRHRQTQLVPAQKTAADEFNFVNFFVDGGNVRSETDNHWLSEAGGVQVILPDDFAAVKIAGSQDFIG